MIAFDEQRRTVNGRRVTRMQWVILDVLRRANGNPVHISRIADSIYGDDVEGGPLWAEAAVRVHIYHLRRRHLEIETIWGHGYRLPHDSVPDHLGVSRAAEEERAMTVPTLEMKKGLKV